MQVFVNYPNKENSDTFLNNLAIFKAKLLINSIERLNVSCKIKYKVLEKVLELLNNKSTDNVI